MKLQVVEKLADLFTPIVKRLLDPATQERLYKHSLDKRRRKALEIAEQHLLKLFKKGGYLDFCTKHIKLKTKLDRRQYARMVSEIHDDYKLFFKLNN